MKYKSNGREKKIRHENEKKKITFRVEMKTEMKMNS